MVKVTEVVESVTMVEVQGTVVVPPPALVTYILVDVCTPALLHGAAVSMQEHAVLRIEPARLDSIDMRDSEELTVLVEDLVVLVVSVVLVLEDVLEVVFVDEAVVELGLVLEVVLGVEVDFVLDVVVAWLRANTPAVFDHMAKRLCFPGTQFRVKISVEPKVVLMDVATITLTVSEKDVGQPTVEVTVTWERESVVVVVVVVCDAVAVHGSSGYLAEQKLSAGG